MGTTTIDIDYYQEIQAKADKLDKIKLKLVEEHDKVMQKISKPSWLRYEVLAAYKDGLRVALDFIDNQTIIKKGENNMSELMTSLRELELKICGKLDESEQSELNYIISCIEERVGALQNLTLGLEIA